MKKSEKLKALYDEIDVLISHHVDCSTSEFTKWHMKVERFFKTSYPDGFADFSNISFGPHIWTDNTPDSVWIEACAWGLREAKDILEVYIEEIQSNEQDDETPFNTDNDVGTSNKKVFVVHGHDGELKHLVARVLEKQSIEPIILSEQANCGATIIEKFEKNSDVRAAICLFTEDDLGKLKTEKELKVRARQNVVFEAGYFIGKLGRNRVILLANKEIEMPSDLSGVVYSNTSSWQFEVLKELKTMGYNIDMNKTI